MFESPSTLGGFGGGGLQTTKAATSHDNIASKLAFKLSPQSHGIQLLAKLTAQNILESK